jgi:hypothetical protein
MKINKTLFLLPILLVLGAVGVLAATTGTILEPSASEVINGSHVVILNMTAIDAGNEVGNITLGYQCTANSTVTNINTTVQNVSANDSQYNVTLDTSAFVPNDCTLTVTTYVYNYTMLGGASSLVATITQTGVVVNNSVMSISGQSPATNTFTDSKTGSQVFNASTSEEVTSMNIYLNGVRYAMTNNKVYKSWGYSATNLPEGTHNWFVEATDQAGGNVITNGTLALTMDTSGAGGVQPSLLTGEKPKISGVTLLILIGLIWLILKKK